MQVSSVRRGSSMNGGVFDLNGDTFTLTQFIATGTGAHGITPSRDGKYLYVANRGSMEINGPPHGPGSVSVIDTSTSAVTEHWAVPGGRKPGHGQPRRDREPTLVGAASTARCTSWTRRRVL